jgi:hypothetical protein
MSDIFLSYVVSDWEKADGLDTVFRREGWTVSSVASKTYPDHTPADAEDIDRELKDTKVLVGLWSRYAARGASLVRQMLERPGAAVPVIVRLDKIAQRWQPTVPCREIDLSDWDGDPSYVGLTSLLHHVHGILAKVPPSSLEELPLPKNRENVRLGINERAESRPEGGARFGGVFISYRRSEAAAYAGRLYDRLAARFGREKVFIDTENVGWGEDFVEAITEAAESCAVMIALISPRWSRGGQEDADDYVRLEVAKALGRKIRVIPILIQGASMPAPKELTEDLAPLVRRNALALSDTRWERDVEDLLKTLEGLLKD